MGILSREAILSFSLLLPSPTQTPQLIEDQLLKERVGLRANSFPLKVDPILKGLHFPVKGRKQGHRKREKHFAS